MAALQAALQAAFASFVRDGIVAAAGAFVQGSPVLSWVGNNTAKLQLQHGGACSNMQCWTLISTNNYGQVCESRWLGDGGTPCCNGLCCALRPTPYVQACAMK
jgi:hypothetical protein